MLVRSAGLGVLTALAVFVSGCGGSSAATLTPEPAFANSVSAERAFHRIEARFDPTLPERRGELEGALREFLTRFGSDGRERLVRVYLAWIEVESGRAREGRELAHRIAAGPAGVVRDLALVVEASALRKEGQNAAALRLLLPLEGKIVDARDRRFYSEELIHALVAAGRFDLAIFAMLDWADQTPQIDREDVVASIEGMIRTMPSPALEVGLRALDADERVDVSPERSRAEARRWLRGAVRETLVRVALTTRDSALAERLVETSAPGVDHEQTRDALAALAASSTVKPRIMGRTIGVILDVTDAASRRRSAAAVAGMTRALGLPTSVEREDSIHLATRDASEVGDVQRALAALAGDGAVILVAGVSDDAAVAASLFAERARIPVVTLDRPAGLPDHASFTFALGASAEAEEEAVRAALEGLGSRSPARAGPGGAPCDAVAPNAGGPRFPVQQWKHANVDALVLAGDPDCARDAANEAAWLGLAPTLVLGLESADETELPGKKMAISAGRFPFGAHDLRADERAWVERWGGAPSWFEVLGRDAALLASAALASFPTDHANDAPKVEKLHRLARDSLSGAKADLWSTQAPGFEGHAAIERTLAAAALPEQKSTSH